MSPGMRLAFILFAGCSAGYLGGAPPRANATAAGVANATSLHISTSSKSAGAVAAMDEVEQALRKLISNPKISPDMLKAAQPVVQEVELAVKDVESGKGSKEEKMKRVASAITSLRSLQGKWEQAALDAAHKEKAMEEKQASEVERIEELKHEIVQKKAMLAKDEGMLKQAKMQRDVLEKQKDLLDSKAREEAQEKKAELASLEAMAKAMATPPPPAKGKTGSKVPASLQHVVHGLEARSHNLSAAIDHMDADEKARESALDKIAHTPVPAPAQGKKDAIKESRKVLVMLKKQALRAYKKARAVKVAELAELNEAIASIKKGDVKALTELMGKIEHESKSLAAKSKNFLY